MGKDSKKYNIYIQIDTDDDAPLLYGGKKFCHYASDLIIKESDLHRHEILNILRSIVVVPEYKASELASEVIGGWVDIVSDENQDLSELRNHYSNQEFEIMVREVLL